MAALILSMLSRMMSSTLGRDSPYSMEMMVDTTERCWVWLTTVLISLLLMILLTTPMFSSMLNVRRLGSSETVLDTDTPSVVTVTVTVTLTKSDTTALLPPLFWA